MIKLKEIGSKLGNGALFGVGFSIVFFLVGFFTVRYFDSLLAESYTNDSMVSNSVFVAEHESKMVDGNFVVLGKLENISNRIWRGLQVEVELFDKDKKFIHECSGYIGADLEAGAVEYFQVNCKGCKDSPIPEFDSYTVAVKSGYAYAVDEKE